MEFNRDLLKTKQGYVVHGVENGAAGLCLVDGGQDYMSWGRVKRVRQRVLAPAWLEEAVNFPRVSYSGSGASLLARGCGRSYGDSCLNDGGCLISTAHLNRLISFDRKSGVIECECGATLEDLLKVAVPSGWFVPVLPGTRYVTVGGAIANDIHGKNHHRSGTFGDHVVGFTLARSDGRVLQCSREENAELFAATIGGLGLTGLIISAKLKLIEIESAYIEVEEIQFRGLQEFFALSQQSDTGFEYIVAWIDCVSKGRDFARGIFMRGNHYGNYDPGKAGSERYRAAGRRLKPRAKFEMPGPNVCVPLDAPSWLLSPWSIRLFNQVYFNKNLARSIKRIAALDKFFFPLDGVGAWNRLYGSNGFYQFQAVLRSREAVAEIFSMIVESGEASFLAVIKEFSDRPASGLLSFPRAGTTLALDFANRGIATTELLGRLERIVNEDHGAIYPAKDALMSKRSFELSFPRVGDFARHIDPRFSSSFWRRVS